jgi:hypothetical protein
MCLQHRHEPVEISQLRLQRAVQRLPYRATTGTPSCCCTHLADVLLYAAAVTNRIVYERVWETRKGRDCLRAAAIKAR